MAFDLSSGAQVFGIVTDVNGVPVMNAQIDVLDAASLQNVFDDFRPFFTDVAGSFSAVLTPGDYVLRIGPPPESGLRTRLIPVLVPDQEEIDLGQLMLPPQ